MLNRNLSLSPSRRKSRSRFTSCFLNSKTMSFDMETFPFLLQGNYFVNSALLFRSILLPLFVNMSALSICFYCIVTSFGVLCLLTTSTLVLFLLIIMSYLFLPNLPSTIYSFPISQYHQEIVASKISLPGS